MVAAVAQNKICEIGEHLVFRLTDETEEIVFAVHDTVAKANENDRTNTEIHEVLHDDVAGVLCAGKSGLHHGKSALHEENENST